MKVQINVIAVVEVEVTSLEAAKSLAATGDMKQLAVKLISFETPFTQDTDLWEVKE